MFIFIPLILKFNLSLLQHCQYNHIILILSVGIHYFIYNYISGITFSEAQKKRLSVWYCFEIFISISFSPLEVLMFKKYSYVMKDLIYR